MRATSSMEASRCRRRPRIRAVVGRAERSKCSCPPPDMTLATDLGFDPEALRERYRQEREKRLRPDGNAQYVEVKGHVPREKSPTGPKILGHPRRIGNHFDLYRVACFQTQVTELRWSDEDRRWLVATNRGDRLRARFVVMSNGPLNRPKLPGIA